MTKSSAQFDRNTLATVKPGLDSTLADMIAQMEIFFAAPTNSAAAIASARTQIRSLLGVLKMVGLEGLAAFCVEVDVTLGDLAANPQQVSVMHRDAVRRALFSITHFLDSLANGASNAALRLFSEYQGLQQLRGMEMSFELDLFFTNLKVQLPQHVLSAAPQSDAMARFKMLRGQYQQGLLKWLRQEDVEASLGQMHQALDGALRCSPQDISRAFWWVGQGLLDCLKQEAISEEMNPRKMLGRIDQQLRSVAEGKPVDVATAMNEMLYMIGRSKAVGERVEEIREIYALDEYLPEANALPPGEIDQLLGVMRDHLRVAEESWELCVQGDKAAGEKFVKYVEQLAEQSGKLDRDSLQYLIKQILELSQHAGSAEQAKPIAMDMAMALLLLGSGIDNYNRLGSGFQQQARILVERMQAAIQQQPEADGQMSELVNLQMEQRVDVMGPLANEMLVNLQHVEQGLNTFFGEPTKRDGLIEILRLLSQILGGFRISSLEHAANLLASVQERVRRFSRSSDVPKSAERYALADALSALENYMQHLTHGQSGDVWRLQDALAEMVKLDQAPAPVTPSAPAAKPQAVESIPVVSLEKVPAVEPATAVPVVQAKPAVPVDQPKISTALEFAAAEKSSVPAMEFTLPEPSLSPPPPPPPPPVAQEISFAGPADAPLEFTSVPKIPTPPTMEIVQSIPLQMSTESPGLSEEEQEMLEIFLEEAGEVLVTIRSNLKVCQSTPGNHEALVTMRRGFHTLKGSGRMVGLNDLGEVAWSVENAMNKWLQDNKVATPGLLKLIDASVHAFSGWVEELSKNGTAVIKADELVAAAQQIENGQEPTFAGAASAQAEMVSAPPEELSMQAPVETIAKTIAPVSAETPGHGTSSSLFNIASTEAKQNAEILHKHLEGLVGTVPPTVHYDFMRAAHTLAGLSRTMGFEAIMELASALEGWLLARVEKPFTLSETQFQMLAQSIAALDEMIQNVCDQQTPQPRSDLSSQLGADKDNFGEPIAEVSDEISAQSLEINIPDLESGLQMEGVNEPVSEQQTEVVKAPEEKSFEQMLEDMDAAAALTETAQESVSEPQAEVAEATEEKSFEQVLEEMDAAAALMETAEEPVSEPQVEVAKAPEEKSFEQILEEMDAAAAAMEPIEEPAIPKIETPLVEPGATERKGENPELAKIQHASEYRAVALEKTEPVVAATNPSATVLQPVVLTVAQAGGDTDKPQVYDELDDQLLPVFLEEADELAPKIGEELLAWRENPQDEQLVNSLKRLLHTMKGSSRMVGAMRIGEIAHEMENQVADVQKRTEAGFWEGLQGEFDRISALLEELRGGKPVPVIEAKPAPARRASDQPAGVERRAERRGDALGNMLRVRSDVVDRMVNEAGEISVARSRIETEMRVFKEGLLELTASVIRLRQQLREVEIQAESQMQARVSLAKDHADQFDPLEFDRFSRLQELTRFMNESVHDVQTVQQTMLKNLDETAAALLVQGRLNRELQQGLMNVRMVSFNSISDRLYRIVRQTGKELNKRANLELLGTNVELDRSVLEKMVAPFEHLLRNSIVHGLEEEPRRKESGKLPIGEIRLSVRQESNEILFEFSDDGAGLNYAKLKEKALANGTMQSGEEASEEQLAQLIFMPGLSTATEITEIAGRGVGMDVVRSEITALGGRIDVNSKVGQGTLFSIYLPLTLAVTQILMVRSGEETYAIPTAMVEQVRQVKSTDMDSLHRDLQIEWQSNAYSLYYLPYLLGNAEAVRQNQPRNPVLLLRSGDQRIALQVDELLGNHEVMVKNIGPQLARLSGVAGATVMGDGRGVLILNPVQLAQRSSIASKLTLFESSTQDDAPATVAKPGKGGGTKSQSGQPLIMVVDDSLTVRKITSRMLTRAGYQVVTATDGVDALEKLQEYSPDVMLLDIEMPRMDGFALAKELRRDPKTQGMPIIMITSRTADKHREYAMQLGVNTYMGKPYQEDDLLQNITDFVAAHKEGT